MLFGDAAGPAFEEAVVRVESLDVLAGGVLTLSTPSRTNVMLYEQKGPILTPLPPTLVIEARMRVVCFAIWAALFLQVLLGLSAVWFGLPLPVATAHNGVAALLLLSLVLLNFQLWQRPQ